MFDREERLADFAKGSAPYAAISGRILAGMLEGQGIGLGVNLEVAPSSILMSVHYSMLEIVAHTPFETAPSHRFPRMMYTRAGAAELSHSVWVVGSVPRPPPILNA